MRIVAVLLLALVVSSMSFGAEPTPKDEALTILQLRKSNLELAMQNMLLQSEVLKQKYAEAQVEYEKVKTELEAKEPKETKDAKEKEKQDVKEK